MNKLCIALSLMLALAAGSLGVAHAANTVMVNAAGADGAMTTLQAALDATVSGDTIVITDSGEYSAASWTELNGRTLRGQVNAPNQATISNTAFFGVSGGATVENLHFKANYGWGCQLRCSGTFKVSRVLITDKNGGDTPAILVDPKAGEMNQGTIEYMTTYGFDADNGAIQFGGGWNTAPTAAELGPILVNHCTLVYNYGYATTIKPGWPTDGQEITFKNSILGSCTTTDTWVTGIFQAADRPTPPKINHSYNLYTNIWMLEMYGYSTTPTGMKDSGVVPTAEKHEIGGVFTWTNPFNFIFSANAWFTQGGLNSPWAGGMPLGASTNGSYVQTLTMGGPTTQTLKTTLSPNGLAVTPQVTVIDAVDFDLAAWTSVSTELTGTDAAGLAQTETVAATASVDKKTWIATATKTFKTVTQVVTTVTPSNVADNDTEKGDLVKVGYFVTPIAALDQNAIKLAPFSPAIGQADDGLDMGSSDPAYTDVPTLDGVILSDWQPLIGVDPQWTHSTTVTLQLQNIQNSPRFVDLDETPDFASPVTKICNSYAMTYTFENSAAGNKTLYVRLRNPIGTSSTVSDTISLDTEAPGKPSIPTDAGVVSLTEEVIFHWISTTDPAPGELGSYDCQIGTAMGQADVYQGNVGNVMQYAVTRSVGETLYCRVRARDKAGNPGPWSESSDGILIVDDKPVSFAGVTLSDTDGANNPAAGWTNSPTVNVTLSGVVNVPRFIDLDEAADFSSPTTLSYSGTRYSYTFDSTQNDLKTVHVRLRNWAGATTKSATIGLDTVAPEAPEAPTDAGGFSLVPQVTINWTAPADPTPGGGIASYNIQLGTAAGGADLFSGNVGAALSRQITGPLGQTVYGRAQAIDKAGNIGDWSTNSDGIFIDTPPDPPNVTVGPDHPKTYHTLTATATTTDADGDAIVAYEYEWVLGGTVRATGPTLAPELTTKNQIWSCRGRAQDARGAWGQFGTASCTIENSPPSQPMVEILPRTPIVGEGLIVDVQTYSEDPDGDSVAYDFAWYKSIDNGTTWVHKTELDGSPQVNSLYIKENELWKVIYTPYEKNNSPTALASVKGRIRAATRVEGFAAWDQVFVGKNKPPTLAIDPPHGVPVGDMFKLNVVWQGADGDGDICKVDLYWTDLKFSGLQPLTTGMDAKTGVMSGLFALPTDRPIYIFGVITDSKGAVDQTVSAAVKLTNSAGLEWQLYP